MCAICGSILVCHNATNVSVNGTHQYGTEYHSRRIYIHRSTVSSTLSRNRVTRLVFMAYCRSFESLPNQTNTHTTMHMWTRNHRVIAQNEGRRIRTKDRVIGLESQPIDSINLIGFRRLHISWPLDYLYWYLDIFTNCWILELEMFSVTFDQVLLQL